MQHLRGDGWTVEVVERWVPGANIRRDLLGCADLLAIKPGTPPLLIQATSDSHHAHRVNKAKAEPRLRTWLQSGGGFEVWSWAKRGGRWEHRVTPLVLGDMASVSAIPPPRRLRRPRERLLFSFSNTKGAA
jgi:hypothetical protein